MRARIAPEEREGASGNVVDLAQAIIDAGRNAHGLPPLNNKD